VQRQFRPALACKRGDKKIAPVLVGTNSKTAAAGVRGLRRQSPLRAGPVRSCDIRPVVSEPRKPFNHVMGFADPTPTVVQFVGCGVKPIGGGSARSQVALAALLRRARQMKDKACLTSFTT